jgi:hypothetical protein
VLFDWFLSSSMILIKRFTFLSIFICRNSEYRESNVELVFVFDGAREQSKESTQKDRRHNKLVLFHRMMHQLV